MLLKNFEDMLKNIESDKMLMSYGDNPYIVNSILSVVNMVQSLSNAIKSDRVSDMFSFTISNKILELESLVVMHGQQRLMERGINVQGNMQYFNPAMQNQQMFNPMQFQQQPVFQQPMYQQPMPQMQQPMQPQYAAQPAPQMAQPPQQPAPPPQPAAATPASGAQQPNEPKPVIDTSQKSSSGGGSAGFSLPGAGNGNEKAVGRDYLLKLLEG